MALVALQLAAPLGMPESVAVRFPAGLLHGFLVLRDAKNNAIAAGDLEQTVVGDRVHSELVFHFKDGSLYKEVVVYSQRRSFRLLTYDLIEKGRSFKHPSELRINATKGLATVIETEDNGSEKQFHEHLKLAGDLANGLLTPILLNIQPSGTETVLSMVVATPKPRVVKLLITRQGEEPFSLGGFERKATVFVIKIEIGGLVGVIAPLVGKQPPDIHAWVLSGQAPGFLKSEGPLYDGGPIWQIELASPEWRR
jgi:hypothetical protein